MKKILSILVLFLAALSVHADDYLRIFPQEVVPGSTDDDERCISIEMINEHTFVGMSFDVYLPVGVRLDEEMGIELSEDRFPYTGKKNKVFDHSVSCSWHEEDGGFYRIIILDYTDNSPIKGNSGPILDFYYISDDDMPTGIIPVRICNVLLGVSSTEGVKPAGNVSFLYTPEADFSAVTSLDLAVDGCITASDVVAEAQTLIANPNALLYVGEGTEAIGQTNVVIGDQCDNLTLTDGYPFHAPKGFTAVAASYTRAVADDGWYSLCLPFAAVPQEGVTVERLQRVDGTTLEFATGDIEGDKPAIFHAQAGSVTFTGSNVAVAATPEVLGDDVFVGSYVATQPGDITGYYALRSDGSGFGVANATAYVTPFRAIVLPVSQASVLHIRHHDFETSIDAISAQNDAAVYMLSGVKASAGNLPKGVYVTSNKKFIIK